MPRHGGDGPTPRTRAPDVTSRNVARIVFDPNTLANSTRGLILSELARSAQLPIPTTFRLVSALAQHGLVEQEQPSKLDDFPSIDAGRGILFERRARIRVADHGLNGVCTSLSAIPEALASF